MKKFFGMLFVALITFTGLTNVNAVDQTIIFYNEIISDSIKIPGAGTTYKEVSTSEGRKIAYCFNKQKEAPPHGSKLEKAPDGILPNDAKTNQYIYILDNGYGGSWNTSVIGTGTYSKHEKYYITQVALWIAQGSLDAETIKNSGNLGKAAYNLYSAAVKNSTVIAYTPEVNLDGKASMKLSGDKYISETITLSVKGASQATVNLVNAPAGSKIIVDGKENNSGIKLNNGTKFQISVPSDKVAKDMSIKVLANTSATRKKIQIYRYDNKLTYQNVGLIFKDAYTASDELNLNIAPKGELLITKVEIVDGKQVNLKGATLVVTDSKGKEIAKWSTTDENPKKITGLTIGETYTISEVVVPEGYKKIADKKVTINSPAIQNVTVVNSEVTPIEISKQHITSKEELPGAHLVVKDSNGNVIDEWVSTTEPHYITKELEPGKYYLTETIAPEGYELSTETIEFTVNKDGKVDGKVVMYNTPKKGVIISKQDVATSKELPGATLVLKDSKGNIIDEWVSTTTPHYIKNLPEGKYTLIETKAPEGYGLSDEIIEFEIKYDGEPTQKVVMYNSIIPETSDNNIVFVIVTLISTIGIGIFSFIRLRKQQA